MDRRFSLLLILAINLLAGCHQSKQQENEGEQASEAIQPDENQALYDEVMKIHDEAMAKMDALYKQKLTLKNKMDSVKSSGKGEFEVLIKKLDSANDEMMDWMHEFKPDSLKGEEYREYMESQLEKVKKVREDILEALKGAEEKNQQ